MSMVRPAIYISDKVPYLIFGFCRLFIIYEEGGLICD